MSQLSLVQKFTLLLSALSLTSCMVGPNFKKPKAPEVESYTEYPLPDKTVSIEGLPEGGNAQEFVLGADIPAQWWKLFHSPELNALIEQGLKNSPTLQAAEATLKQAEENLRSLIGSTLFPTVTGGFTKQRIQNPPFGTTSGIPNNPAITPIETFLTTTFPPYNLYNASVNVSYTVDVFGGNRRSIEVLLAQVDYQRYELLAAYLTLTGNIVTTAITQASLHAQIKATREIVALEAKELEIVKKQYKLGGVSSINVLAQETQLEQTRATLPDLEKSLAEARSAMAVLVGEFPGEGSLPTFRLDDLHLPENLPVSIPSLLVRQRPDIQAAEALLHASTAQIGVATASLLPKFNLTGTYATETGNFQGLFGPGTKLWNWQAQVIQTLFSGGSLLAQREAAIAAFEASYAQYQLAVLTAFKNVSDTLNALDMDAKALQANAAAEKAAKDTLNMVEKQYFLGGVSYLNLLYAQMQYHQAYTTRIISEATRYTDTAALFQSMGGGWWNTDELKGEDE